MFSRCIFNTELKSGYRKIRNVVFINNNIIQICYYPQENIFKVLRLDVHKNNCIGSATGRGFDFSYHHPCNQHDILIFSHGNRLKLFDYNLLLITEVPIENVGNDLKNILITLDGKYLIYSGFNKLNIFDLRMGALFKEINLLTQRNPEGTASVPSQLILSPNGKFTCILISDSLPTQDLTHRYVKPRAAIYDLSGRLLHKFNDDRNYFFEPWSSAHFKGYSLILQTTYGSYVEEFNHQYQCSL